MKDLAVSLFMFVVAFVILKISVMTKPPFM